MLQIKLFIHFCNIIKQKQFIYFMKKGLKYFGVLIVIFILIIVVAGLFIQISGIPKYDTQAIDFEIKSTEKSIERGKKLALLLCAGCHANPETGKLSGNTMLEAPPEFGFIYAPNITQDLKHGIGEWKASEIAYLLRTGIKRDGNYAPPWMAKLPHLADEDMNAILSFLKSNDPLVAADTASDKPCEPSFLSKFLCRVAFKPLPYPAQTITMPDTSNVLALGKYYAHNLECFSCHSADYKTNNYLEPEKSEGYFGGGNHPLDKEGRMLVTSNLTPDDETGIGRWTKDKFVKAVKFGLKDNGNPLRFPMVPYVHLTDFEAGAIYEYLRTIPAIKNDVTKQ